MVIVIVSTVREDTAATAAWLVDGLRARGHEAKVARAVTLLAAPDSRPADVALHARLHGHFAQLTRAVIDVPTTLHSPPEPRSTSTSSTPARARRGSRPPQRSPPASDDRKQGPSRRVYETK